MPRTTQRLEQRNQHVLDRYIYWTEERRIRFDDAITILAEEEFHLGEDTVMGIIRKMLREGKRGSNGLTASRPRFMGFRTLPKPLKRKVSVLSAQPSLFGDE